MGRLMEKVVGIDAGTSNCVIAYPDAITKLGECCRNDEGSDLTASAVCIHSKSAITVGNVARECALIYSDRTKQLYKREMGVEKVSIEVDGEKYSPQQITALVLGKLKKDAENELGEKIDEAVITVPAYFDSNAREATKEAGELAGFRVLDLLDEPVAALYNADSFENLKGNSLVFDLGGGTLDIVAVTVTKDVIDEKVIAGDIHLGGSDWDRALLEEIRKKYLKGIRLNVEEEQELVLKTESAKKVLSDKEQTKFSISTSGQGKIEITVTRAEFEACTEHLLGRAKEILLEVKEKMEQKGILRLDHVVLAGGSTKMPQIPEMIRDVFEDPKLRMIAKEVDKAVAKGCAIYAAGLKREKQPDVYHSFKEEGKIKKLNRVTSRSYGVEAYVDGTRKMVCNMIFQNDELPKNVEDTFYTRYDGQEAVRIGVFESTTDSRHLPPSDAKLLGSCMLKILGNLPENSPISIELCLHEDGTLHVRGFEPSGETEVTAVLQTRALLTEDEFDIQKEQIEDLLLVI